MVTVTFAQLEHWIILFFWPFCRFSGLLLLAPVLSHSSIPAPVKLGMAAIITVVISPILGPLPTVPLFSWASFGIILEQLIIGAAIGLVMQIVFASVQAAA